MLFVTDVITDLHLLFNQVLRLDERPNELFSLLSLQVSDLVLMDNIGFFELPLLGLQFMLLVNELLPENPLLIVQVKEHAQVLVQLAVLLCLYDPFNLSLFRHFLPDDLYFGNLSKLVLLQKALLLLFVVLCLHVPLLPQLLFQQRLVMLIELPRLPQGHLQSSAWLTRSIILITVHSGGSTCFLQHFLLDALVGLVGRGEICSVQL